MINNFADTCFSNFFPCVIAYGGLEYPSVEAAYQACKTTDISKRKEFTRMTAGKAKREGKKLSIRPDWKEIKDCVMFDLLIIKFSQPALLTQLIATGDEELVEGNCWHDNYWGDCSCQNCASIVGRNTLGKLLMRVREMSVGILEYISEIQNHTYAEINLLLPSWRKTLPPLPPLDDQVSIVF